MYVAKQEEVMLTCGRCSYAVPWCRPPFYEESRGWVASSRIRGLIYEESLGAVDSSWPRAPQLLLCQRTDRIRWPQDPCDIMPRRNGREV